MIGNKGPKELKLNFGFYLFIVNQSFLRFKTSKFERIHKNSIFNIGNHLQFNAAETICTDRHKSYP